MRYNIIIKNDADLDRLLEAYYAGDTAPVHERAIAGYFAGLDAVPEKYKADAELFKALEHARESLDDICVPDDLAHRIARATYGAPKAMRRIGYVRWLSVAAALALFVPVAVNLLRSEPEAQPVNSYAASDLRKDSVLQSVEIHVAEADVDNAPDNDTDTVAVSATSKKTAAIAKADPVQEIENDPYIEISDSASVTEIMKMVFGKLDNSLAMAEKSIRKKDIALNDISETVNNILNK